MSGAIPILFLCLTAAAARAEDGPPKVDAAPTPPAAADLGEGDTTDPRVEALIDDLESGDAAVRDAATRALVRVGPPAVGPLDARLAEAPSPELAGRAKRVRDGINRLWRNWDPAAGMVCAGLQATLRPAEDALTFRAGEAILFNVEFRNVSPEPREMVDVRGVDLDLGKNASFTSPFSDGRLIVRRLDDDNAPAAPNVGRALVYETGEPRTVRLKSGGRALTPVRVDECVTLPPGEYELRFVYYAKSKALLADAASNLRTTPVNIKVVEAARAKD